MPSAIRMPPDEHATKESNWLHRGAFFQQCLFTPVWLWVRTCPTVSGVSPLAEKLIARQPAHRALLASGALPVVAVPPIVAHCVRSVMANSALGISTSRFAVASLFRQGVVPLTLLFGESI